MAKPPAVVMVARHGMRLDAADQSWHMSTPTPYDPPLTYGGWTQCRALGVRIASLLHAREQEINNAPVEVTAEPSLKRKRRKHRVIIHTSPFLRCVQTSVAISAGIAQYQAPTDSGRLASGRTRGSMHSASPRLRGLDGSGQLHSLTPIIEPQHDGLAKQSHAENKRYRKSKLRVDAFLGEWMNPSYFEHITPPPPSPMMVAGAKAELLQNDTVDTYTPTIAVKTNGGSMWSPSPASARPASREGSLDNWSPVSDSLPSPVPRRDRGSSVSSVGSNESNSGRKSPFRSGHMLQPNHHSILKEELATYVPPQPTYAISSSDVIPRGYFAHARNACTDVDIQWDSSRPPQDWGDGGAIGEEWSEMHRRFRGGLTDLVEWYSQHSIDDRGDDLAGPDNIRVEDDDVEEDLVVVLVTHSAGSNALIGALTGQPVLLDVGMASLTMAVRKDDATTVTSMSLDRESPDSFAYTEKRRGSLDLSISNAYDMKLVSSSEHLRPGSDPSKPGAVFSSRRASENVSRPRFQVNGSSKLLDSAIDSSGDFSGSGQGNTSTALGTIRRPSNPSNAMFKEPIPGKLKKHNTTPSGFGSAPTTPMTVSGGLWAPPGSRKADPASEKAQSKDTLSTKHKIIDRINSEPPPGTAENVALESVDSYLDAKPLLSHVTNGTVLLLNGNADENKTGTQTSVSVADGIGTLPSPLSRGLIPNALWGKSPTGDGISRRFPEVPKRRWTVVEDQ